MNIYQLPTRKVVEFYDPVSDGKVYQLSTAHPAGINPLITMKNFGLNTKQF